MYTIRSRTVPYIRCNNRSFRFLPSAQVEGGRIDHALHDTNAKRAILDLLAFEKAVEVALRMTNPKETLVIVGADHSHVMTINGYPARGNPILGDLPRRHSR